MMKSVVRSSQQTKVCHILAISSSETKLYVIQNTLTTQIWHKMFLASSTPYHRGIFPTDVSVNNVTHPTSKPYIIAVCFERL